MLAQIELSRDLAIGVTFGHQVHNAIFSPCQWDWQSRMNRCGWRTRSQNIDQEVQFLAASPNLPLVDRMDALAQQLKRFIAGEYAAGSCPESFDHRQLFHRIKHHDDVGRWMRCPHFSRDVKPSSGSVLQVSANDGNVDVVVGKARANVVGARCIANYRESVSAAAQGGGHQLTAHSASVSDKDVYRRPAFLSGL
jgi:hypothetical protein